MRVKVRGGLVIRGFLCSTVTDVTKFHLGKKKELKAGSGGFVPSSLIDLNDLI